MNKYILIILNLLQKTDVDNRFFEWLIINKLQPKIDAEIITIGKLIKKYIPEYLIKILDIKYSELSEGKITSNKFCRELVKKYNSIF